MPDRDDVPPQDRDLDAPTPPGGPLRQDAPGEGAHHGGDEEPNHPGVADGPEESGEPDGDTDPAPRDLQEENAETSLDQPSQ